MDKNFQVEKVDKNEDETSNYNLGPCCSNWLTENTRQYRHNHSINEMIETFELTNIQGCLLAEIDECKVSPHELVSLGENDFEKEVGLFERDVPKCFKDSDILSTDDFKTVLENEEQQLREEHRFQSATFSPFVQSRMSASFKKEEKIFLMKEPESFGLKTSDATLEGLAYNVHKYVSGNKITYKLAIHNMGRHTIYAKVQLCLYSNVKKILKDLRFGPSRLVLEEKVLQSLHISFTCETKNFDKLNLPHFGFVILTYESGNDHLCEERTSFSLESCGKGKHEMVQNNISKSLTQIGEGWWNIEPSEVLLSPRVQKARIALINNSGRNIRFKLLWDCSFICVSPIHGIISAKGDLGLRLSLPCRIKYGETFIRVICSNTSKAVRVLVKKITGEF